MVKMGRPVGSPKINRQQVIIRVRSYRETCSSSPLFLCYNRIEMPTKQGNSVILIGRPTLRNTSVMERR